MSHSFTVNSARVEDTGHIAARLASCLVPGDVIILSGDLGAGKTTFARHLVAAMGSADPVTSPTFTLAQFYSAPRGTVLHIDAYRLENVDEYRNLGLDEFVETAVTLVEWGEMVETEFADPLRVSIHMRETGRDITVSSSAESTRWSNDVDRLHSELAGDAR